MCDSRGALRKFRQLSGLQQRTVLLVVVLIPVCWLALRIFGVGRVLKWLRTDSDASALSAEALEVVTSLGHAVNVAGRSHFLPMSCLTRSVLLAWLLRWRGVGARVRIGAKLSSGRLAAHAWVECQGVPVNDRRDIAGEFAPFNEVAPFAAFHS